MPHRMFVAVVPPLDVVEDLSDFLEPRRGVGMPWIHPEQWHVTLAFMGAVRDRSVDALHEHLELAAAKRHPFVVRLAGAGAFPDAVRAKVLWLGLRQGDAGPPGAAGPGLDGPAELERLAVNVRAAATTAGTAVDGKVFRPHLSLAHLKRPVEATRWLRILDTYSGPGWQVEQVELVSSHLGDGPGRRPRHEVVGTFRLGRRSAAGR